jgi:hypothetical protein
MILEVNLPPLLPSPCHPPLPGSDYFGGPITRFDIPLMWSSISSYEDYHWQVTTLTFLISLTLILSLSLSLVPGVQSPKCAPSEGPGWMWDPQRYALCAVPGV